MGRMNGIRGASRTTSGPCQVRISPDVLSRELANETVLLDLKSQHYFGLDPVGTRMWQLLCETGHVDSVVNAILEEFDVDEGRLRQDLEAFLSQLEDAGLVEVELTLAEHSS